MKKRYLIIALLFIFSFVLDVNAMKIDDCEVLVSFKQSSSLDEDTYICKGKKFGGVVDSIYYSGEGSTIYLNNFNGYYLSNNDASGVAFNITGENNISTFHISQNKVRIIGEGSLKFKEGSYVKKVTNGEAVYNYLYNNSYLVLDNKLYEGTNNDLLEKYELLKETNKLPEEFNLKDYQMIQAIDYTKMSSVVITEMWLNNKLDTSLSKSVVDGYGVVKYIKEEVSENTLKSEDVVFVSEKKVNSNYELKVTDLKSNDISNKVEDLLDENELLNLYDISVYNGKKEVTMKDGIYTIKIKVTNLAEYSDYQIIYVNDDGEIEEYIDASLDGDYIVFKTSHLSHYGVIAKKMVEPVLINEDKSISYTGTIIKCSILIIVALLLIGLISFVVIKSNQFNKTKKKA
ncbi:MAG: hypothetical protein IJ475_01380 [Bacilli bacterium]|nr:hypothetical protein [Bacilli bacterium]